MKKNKTNVDRLFSRYKTYTDGPRGSSDQWKRQAEKLKGSSSDSALALLGITNMPTSLSELKRLRRKAMLEAHPDRGGSEEAAARINGAFELLAQAFAASSNSNNQNKNVADQGVVDPARCTGVCVEESPHHVAELKIDGERCMMYIGVDPYGERCGTTMLSRYKGRASGKYTDKTDYLSHIAGVSYEGLSDTVLDGELFLENFEKTSSAIRKNSSEKCYYHVFDIVRYKGEDVRCRPLSERRALLESVVAAMGNPYVLVVEQYGEQFISHFNRVVAEGGEGLIVKDIRSQYGFDWAKLKKAYDVSAIITGFREGKDPRYVGSFALSVYDDEGELAEIGHVSASCAVSEFHLYLGKVVDVFAHELTKNQKLRMPSFHRYREDITPNECTMQKLKADFQTVKRTRK